MIAIPFALAVLLGGAQEDDPREQYDVMLYDLALEVHPEEELLTGRVTVHAVVTADSMEVLQLDLEHSLDVERVTDPAGNGLAFAQVGDSLHVSVPVPHARGERFAYTIEYSGSPRSVTSFAGFHWMESEDGSPWINTSCQGLGAHSWWPCKASYFHPEDKPDEGTRMSITAPAGLYAVSNGRLADIVEHEDGRRTFQWVHPYPLETYCVTLNVGPYVVVEDKLTLKDGARIPWNYYVLPENAEKAALQFQQVPELVHVFEEAFGPWPFPDSKFALVETNFWGMEHSTAVAYGSSYPAWCEANGVEDPYARRHRYFDYILVHEVAHEWWGNAVSATAWGHFWIHEGFGTYAEGVYVEATQSRARADEYFASKTSRIAKDGRLYRGDDVDSRQAYDGVIYSKGACVLNTLRHYVDDDDAWWRSLAAFNQRFRYGNASTDDFRAVLEAEAGGDWSRFFDEWVYGEGHPEVRGVVRVEGTRIVLDIENGATASTTFFVPLDVRWREHGELRTTRVWLEPGHQTHRIACASAPEGVEVVHLNRVLGEHDVRVAR